MIESTHFDDCKFFYNLPEVKELIFLGLGSVIWAVMTVLSKLCEIKVVGEWSSVPITTKECMR